MAATIYLSDTRKSENKMFTGLIETVGTIEQIVKRSNYKVMRIQSGFDTSDLEIGESIACDGSCLTVVSFDTNSFTVEVSQETAVRTIIEHYKVGTNINLERAMKLGSRLGGHLVSGHIDCRGKIEYVKPVGDSIEVAVRFDTSFDDLTIEKGSIAINGISLTINSIKQGWLSVNIIPHTESETTITHFKTSDPVNLEFDMIGKYLLKFIQNKNNKGLTIDKLIESGW